MYTCCPECGTSFRVTAEQLGVAQGDVRCGSCGIAFNALKSLRDELPEAEEVRVDEPTNEASDDDHDESLEFNAPEQTWGSIFMEAESVTMETADDEESTTEHTGRGVPPQATGFDLDMETADHGEWEALLAEVEDVEGPVYMIEPEPAEDHPGSEAPAAADESEFVDETADTGELEEIPETEIAASSAMDDEAAGEEDVHATLTAAVIEPARPVEAEPAVKDESPLVADEEDAAWPTHRVSAEENALPEGVPPWLRRESPAAEVVRKTDASAGRGWLAGTLVLLVVLTVQLLHVNRDGLASHPRYGPTVRAIYARMGLQLYPEWSLKAYEVLGSEAVAGRSQADALDIVARVEVGGSQPVGMPLIRLVLQDRWSNTVGSRVFRPQEYVTNADQLPQTVGPGTAIPVRISVIDPGANAQGYMVDVCLPRRYSGLQCQNTLSPFQR